ncbi:hypothetical protein V6N13_002788 [Hibiscus sabdariffa]
MAEISCSCHAAGYTTGSFAIILCKFNNKKKKTFLNSSELQRGENKMEDEAEIYDGIRAQFPLTFGKQQKSQTSLEAVHNATRRSTASKNSDNKTDEALPSVSSSSNIV